MGSKDVRVVSLLWVVALLWVSGPRPAAAGEGALPAAGLAPALEVLEDAIARALVQLDALEMPDSAPSPRVSAGPVVPAVGGPDLALAALRRLARTLERRLDRLAAHPAVAGDPRRRAVVAAMREDLRRLVRLVATAGTVPRADLATTLRGLLVDLDGATAALWTLE